MHSRTTVAEALRLRDEEGLDARRVASRLEISVGTVRDWYAGKLPRHSRTVTRDGAPIPPACPHCNQDEHDLAALPKAYVYLLGLYLGDGTISAHRRGVQRLRIFLDRKYPGIVSECEAAMAEVMPRNRVERLLTVSNCFQVSSYSRAWPCLFPQHGPGRLATPPLRVRQRLHRRHLDLLHGLREARAPVDRGVPEGRAEGGDDLRLVEGRRRADGRVHRAEELRSAEPNRDETARSLRVRCRVRVWAISTGSVIGSGDIGFRRDGLVQAESPSLRHR